MPRGEPEDPGNRIVGRGPPPARFTGTPYEGLVVGLADAVESHLPAKAVERSFLLLEHRRQQVFPATGEQVGDICGSLHGVPDRAFQTAWRRPRRKLRELLELIEHHHHPLLNRSRRPIEPEQHLHDPARRGSRRRELELQTHRAKGELGRERPKGIAKLFARFPALSARSGH